jgi:hypothetical protein
MANVEVNCSNCGAQAPAPDDGTPAKCMYCGGNIQYQKPISESEGQTANPQLKRLATSAWESDNHKESEKYFSQIIEQGIHYPAAWLYKGLSVAWQSSINEFRAKDLGPAFKNAFESCETDQEFVEVAEAAATDGVDTLYGLALHSQNFVTEHGGPINSVFDENIYGGHVSRIFDILTVFTDIVLPAFEDSRLEEYPHQVSKRYLEVSGCIYRVLVVEHIHNINPFNSINAGWIFQFDEESEFYQKINNGIQSVVERYENMSDESLSELGLDREDVKDPRVDLLQQATDTANGGDWCFVATATLHDQDWRELATLRQFRDEILLPNKAGAAFVRWYYRYGPIMARWIATRKHLKELVRAVLILPVARFISRLRQ